MYDKPGRTEEEREVELERLANLYADDFENLVKLYFRIWQTTTKMIFKICR